MAKTVIVGAGVVGTALAYELLRDGHQVTVLEKNTKPAEGTSYANAGLIAPGHSFAWASPKAPKILLQSLFKGGQALRFKPSADPALWSWMLKFLGQCTAGRAERNTLAKHALCLYSQACLERVTEETGIPYHHIGKGLLYLYRKPESFAAGTAHMKLLQDDGQEMQFLSGAEAAGVDPALEPSKHLIAGAVYCPTDGSGDARLFTRNLAGHCARNGVSFRYGTTVDRVMVKDGTVAAVRTDQGEIEADTVIFCTGVLGMDLLKGHGLPLPVYPVKGYSMTVPLDAESPAANRAPTVGGVDEDHLVAYARIGDRMRLTAVAEFSGYDRRYSDRDFDSMLKSAGSLFPGVGDYGKAEKWAGLRPMTPTGLPFMAPTRTPGLYASVGHGHMGWTMACGSARLMADAIAGKPPALPMESFALPN